MLFNNKRYIATYNDYLKNNQMYNNFISEMKYTKMNTEYKLQYEHNKIFKGEYNYNFIFNCDSNTKYILQFIYFEDFIGPFKNTPLYNVSFTTYDQYLKYLSTKTEEEQEKIYEAPTLKGEHRELIQRLIYIFEDFHNNINTHNQIYVIGETDDVSKIEWYRNLIKDSIPNIKEIKGDSSINKGKQVYYFY